MTLPLLSMWIIEGGRTQQSASGGVSSASSSISVRSLGRFNTQTLSSLSTANPVTPPIFHLFGRGLGQSGSNLNFGGDCSCAASNTHQTNKPRPANPANTERHTFLLLFINPLLVLSDRRFPMPPAWSQKLFCERDCPQNYMPARTTIDSFMCGGGDAGAPIITKTVAPAQERPKC